MELAAFSVVVAVVAVVGLRLGMLLATRLTREATPDEEDRGPDA